jgi:hypothetical protein
MKKTLLAASLSVFAMGAYADPGYMLGVSYSLDGQASMKNLGFSAKILTSDREDKWVGAAGVSLFPWADRKLGLDVGGGYTFEDSTALVSYDFLQAKPLVSYGWTDTIAKRIAKRT